MPDGIVRVVVADDDPLFSEFLCVEIGGLPGMEVVGTARDGLETIQLVDRLAPDVVALDVNMPRLDGVETSRMILERTDETAVVLISGSDHEGVGFISKTAVHDELLGAIESAGREKRRLRHFQL